MRRPQGRSRRSAWPPVVTQYCPSQRMLTSAAKRSWLRALRRASPWVESSRNHVTFLLPLLFRQYRRFGDDLHSPALTIHKFDRRIAECGELSRAAFADASYTRGGYFISFRCSDRRCSPSSFAACDTLPGAVRQHPLHVLPLHPRQTGHRLLLACGQRVVRPGRDLLVCCQDLIGVRRFTQKVICAQLGGRQRGCDAAITGQHDDADRSRQARARPSRSPAPSCPAAADPPQPGPG